MYGKGEDEVEKETETKGLRKIEGKEGRAVERERERKMRRRWGRRQ